MSKFYNVRKIEKFGRKISGPEARDKVLENKLIPNTHLVAVVNNNLNYAACDISDKEDFIDICTCFLNGYFSSMQIYEVDIRVLGDDFVYEPYIMKANL